MKSYKSHKVVLAAKIVFADHLPETGCAALKLEDDQVVTVGHQWLQKHGEPAQLLGGYFVRYADGYTSWSPTDAFEEGYTEHSLDPKEGALPVAGYRAQTPGDVRLVNSFKETEERILRQLDALADAEPRLVDPRWLAIGRTHLEQAFMAINRSIFRPGRVNLPEDEVE